MSHTTLASRGKRTTNSKLSLPGLSLADVDFASAKRYLPVFLVAGATCLIIVTYVGRSYNPLIDEYKTLYNATTPVKEPPISYNQCVTRCEEALQQAMDVKPNYKLPFNFSESTCSFNATHRGVKQRIISYSFYGDVSSVRSYFQGIERNARQIRQLYPGWEMRVYHNIIEPHERHLLCQTQCSYGDVLDTCFVGQLPGYGNLTGSQPNVWRFLAICDPLVDVVLSRDLDSNLNEREVAAVQEWLQSDASMHVMRDHHFHNVAMLAGMWGVRLNDSNRCEWRVMLEHLLLRAKVAGTKSLDQDLLAEEVWKYANRQGWLLQHDSYYCERYKTMGKMLTFPTQRRTEPMNFVGSRYNVDTKPLNVECPLVCRRDPAWKFC